ncbi:MAG: hypothetical protein PHT94_00610 [Candidatus Nanoarchaeia archaeon]|nr:hypothetical protein [Candidatus Nanoarchaeia archaeon]
MIKTISETKNIHIHCNNYNDDVDKILEMINKEVNKDYIHSFFYDFYKDYDPYGHCGTIKIVSEDFCNNYTTFLISVTHQRMEEHVLSFVYDILKGMENTKYIINSATRLNRME